MIDVVFNHRFARTLAHYYRQKGIDRRVLSMPMYLSLGDISQLAFIESRKTVYKIKYAHENESEHLTSQAVQNLKKAIDNLSNLIYRNESFRIWWSNNADDYCGFLWMCDQLVNTDVVTTAIHVPMVFPTGADELLTISEIGELSASAIDQLQLFELETQLTKNQRNDYRYYWIRLRGENNPIRTIVNGITISQSIDFYDRFVIANLSRQRFRDIIRVIDETVSNYPFAPSWWYRHRIDYLVSKGSVVFKPGSPDIVESQIGKIKLKQ